MHIKATLIFAESPNVSRVSRSPNYLQLETCVSKAKAIKTYSTFKETDKLFRANSIMFRGYKHI